MAQQKPESPELLERRSYESAYRKPKVVEDSPLSTFRLQGLLRPGNRTQHSVDGEDFHITKDTWIIGDLNYGCMVQVKGVLKLGQGRIATKITIVRY